MLVAETYYSILERVIRDLWGAAVYVQATQTRKSLRFGSTSVGCGVYSMYYVDENDSRCGYAKEGREKLVSTLGRVLVSVACTVLANLPKMSKQLP